MLRIAIIVGSTRDTRFADKPAQWIYEKAKARDDMEVELVDIRDYDLPFFNEPASNAWMPTSDPNAVRWQKKIGEFDGYVFVTSEYNRSIPASLKNALDQAYVEWNHKAAGIVAYGSVGGANAAGHLRDIAIELQMAVARSTAFIAGAAFMTVHPMGQNKEMSEIEEAVGPSADNMLNDLVWWAKAAKAAREA